MSSASSTSTKRVLNSHDDSHRPQSHRAKRRTVRILGKLAVCICSLSTCATIVWLALYMRKEIFNFSEISPTYLDHYQSIDEAEFDYFGPQNENFWRAFLIANLAISFLVSLYIPLGVFFEHYYPIMVYGTIMFCESVLSIANQYMSVPYFIASGIFFLTGLSVHVFVHFLRLDLVDDLMAAKQYEMEELLKQHYQQEKQMLGAATTTSVVEHERSSSFELQSMRQKS